MSKFENYDEIEERESMCDYWYGQGRHDERKRIKEIVENVPNNSHTLGGRPWCIECNSRIKGWILQRL